MAAAAVPAFPVQADETLPASFDLRTKGLVSKVHAFIAPKLIGGREALTPVEGEGFARLSDAVELTRVSAEPLAGDILLTGYVVRR